MPIKGILPISAQQAKNQAHYVFNFNNQGRLVEIINNTYNNPRLHPLTNFAVKRVVISHTQAQEVRTFYDVNDLPMANIRGVFKEVYLKDKHGFIYQLDFFDQDNKPMQSRWNIARYQWHKHNSWVIEQRFNVAGDKQPLSPYFPFDDTAIEYDKQGNPFRHYNLDKQQQIANNQHGVAYYQDEYDALGQHVKYAYFDKHQQLTENQWQFAYGIKHYDEQGKYTGRTKYDVNDNIVPNLGANKKHDAKQEESAITRVALGYLQALETLNPDLMAEVLHKDLTKHFVPPFAAPNNAHTLRPTTYERMLEHAEHWNRSGMRFPPKPTNRVSVLDQYNNMATVKMVSDNWVEYLHLVKLKGQWKIKNLMWDYNRP